MNRVMDLIDQGLAVRATEETYETIINLVELMPVANRIDIMIKYQDVLSQSEKYVMFLNKASTNWEQEGLSVLLAKVYLKRGEKLNKEMLKALHSYSGSQNKLLAWARAMIVLSMLDAGQSKVAQKYIQKIAVEKAADCEFLSEFLPLLETEF